MYRYRRRIRSLSTREALIGAALVVGGGAAAMFLYRLGVYTPRIVERGQVTAASRRDPARHVTAATRMVVLRRRFWQVEFPNGVWIDCRLDCAKTLRHAAFNE